MTLAFQAEAAEFFGWLRTYLTSTFDWFFLLSANIFVLFSLLLVVPPLGSLRLGGPGAKPDYSYISCFAMLFASGLGLGLLFFGVSEPMSLFPSSMGGTAMAACVRRDSSPVGGA